MKCFAIVISVLGLLLSVVPSFFVFYGKIDWNLHVNLMIVGMVLWFASAPFWMKTKPNEES
jgi:hypothetical protein